MEREEEESPYLCSQNDHLCGIFVDPLEIRFGSESHRLDFHVCLVHEVGERGAHFFLHLREPFVDFGVFLRSNWFEISFNFTPSILQSYLKSTHLD